MTKEEMTKEEWLARCALVYDMGYVNRPGLLNALDQAADTFDRLVHDETNAQLGRRWSYDKHQTASAMRNVENAAHRTVRESREAFGDKADAPTVTLANDPILYGAVNVAAILSHPCQLCATDPHAWHTRAAFCEHGNGFFSRKNAAPEPEPETPS